MWLSKTSDAEKSCQIVCRVSRKLMESRFLDQDVDVVRVSCKQKCSYWMLCRQELLKNSHEDGKAHGQHQGHEYMDSDLVLT